LGSFVQMPAIVNLPNAETCSVPIEMFYNTEIGCEHVLHMGIHIGHIAINQ